MGSSNLKCKWKHLKLLPCCSDSSLSVLALLLETVNMLLLKTGPRYYYCVFCYLLSNHICMLLRLHHFAINIIMQNSIFLTVLWHYTFIGKNWPSLSFIFNSINISGAPYSSWKKCFSWKFTKLSIHGILVR